jgi:hypothetical protein
VAEVWPDKNTKSCQGIFAQKTSRPLPEESTVTDLSIRLEAYFQVGLVWLPFRAGNLMSCVAQETIQHGECDMASASMRSARIRGVKESRDEK